MGCVADLRFAAAKARSLLRRPAFFVSGPVDGPLQTLRRDGVVVLPGYFEADTIRAVRSELGRHSVLLGADAGVDVIDRQARRLLLNPRRHVPTSAVLLDDDRVRGLAGAYLRGRAVPDREAIQVKNVVGQASTVDFHHIDEWRPLVSTFIHLDDVGADNAPMEYLARSHHWRPWRLRLEQDFHEFYGKDATGAYTNEESAYAGCLLPTQVRRLAERHGWRRVSCEGPPGTLVVFDNRGLHRARPLRSGSRLLVSSYWQLSHE